MLSSGGNVSTCILASSLNIVINTCLFFTNPRFRLPRLQRRIRYRVPIIQGKLSRGRKLEFSFAKTLLSFSKHKMELRTNWLASRVTKIAIFKDIAHWTDVKMIYLPAS